MFRSCKNIRELLQKREKIRKENEKVANRKLRKVGNLRNLGKVIPSFLVSEFLILPYSQNRKLGFKNLPRFPRFPIFPSFQPGPCLYMNIGVCIVIFIIYMNMRA